jgi:hypothetical protein
MEWMQVLTIIAATVGSTYAFYMITADRINRMENFHREDINRMDDKFTKIDEKWERLFEKLLIKEEKNK